MKYTILTTAAWTLALVVTLGISAAPAVALTSKNSTAFNVKGCEGDSLPCSATVVTDVGFVPDGTGNYLYDQSINGHIGAQNQFLDATGWTIEARVKVDTPNPTSASTLVGQLSAGDDVLGYYQVNIAATRIYGIATTNYDLTQWTTIRMAKLPQTNAVYLWLNDVEVAGDPFAPSGPGLQRNWQVIGDGTGATGGKLLIDYVRSDSTGAYAPGSIPGDYDGNGTVDSADYAVWRSTFESTLDLRADGNGDLVVDEPDYVIWRKAAPASGSGTLLATSVPEPTSLGLLVLAFGLAAGFKCSTRCSRLITRC